MVVAGAGGHAKEIISIIEENNFDNESVYFFDDTSDAPENIFHKYKVIKNINEVAVIFDGDVEFVLGTGSPQSRKALFQKLTLAGGKCVSAISSKASIGSYNILAEGLNILPSAVLTNEIEIHKGTLIHIGASIHHNCIIGEFCEISPGSRILGHVKIGNCCSIGAGAIVLPRITLGDHVIVGAGAVVTKDVQSHKTVKGVPAK